jgi:hypothetical protein
MCSADLSLVPTNLSLRRWRSYYVAFCVAVATLTAVPDARTLEAKSARTSRVKERFMTRPRMGAIVVV